jgi:hypothetical protein
MNHLGLFSFALCACSVPAFSQQDPADTPRHGPAPIYEVTVEQRTIPAINYGQRDQPTKIDFQGTVLLPKAKGGAKVQGRAGVVAIDAKFEKLPAPERFGPQYLAYVLWAITPEGRPVNLGEVQPGASNNAKLKVTTHLQAFGLLVSAEPYYSVTRPSNIVVLENVVQPGTQGKVEQVEAKYELLPRGPAPVESRPVEIQAPSEGKKLPMDQYEAVVALYQAQNALQIARAQGADRYASDTLQRAEQLYQQAQKLESDKHESKRVVMVAREAAQSAEDARTIAMAHNHQ